MGLQGLQWMAWQQKKNVKCLSDLLRYAVRFLHLNRCLFVKCVRSSPSVCITIRFTHVQGWILSGFVTQSTFLKNYRCSLFLSWWYYNTYHPILFLFVKDLERDKLKIIHSMQHMMCKKKWLDITCTVIIWFISNISSQLFLIGHFSARKNFKSHIIRMICSYE